MLRRAGYLKLQGWKAGHSESALYSRRTFRTQGDSKRFTDGKKRSGKFSYRQIFGFDSNVFSSIQSIQRAWLLLVLPDSASSKEKKFHKIKECSGNRKGNQQVSIFSWDKQNTCASAQTSVIGKVWPLLVAAISSKAEKPVKSSRQGISVKAVTIGFCKICTDLSVLVGNPKTDWSVAPVFPPRVHYGVLMVFTRGWWMKTWKIENLILIR